MWVITLSLVTIDGCKTKVKENCTASSSSSHPASQPTAELLMKNNIKQKLIIHDPAIIFNGFS